MITHHTHNTESQTLSSMVSNLVRMMPSMSRGLVMLEWSASAWLNLVSWSTASFPTSASPTNSTRSGWFTLISCKEEQYTSETWHTYSFNLLYQRCLDKAREIVKNHKTFLLVNSSGQT